MAEIFRHAEGGNAKYLGRGKAGALEQFEFAMIRERAAHIGSRQEADAAFPHLCDGANDLIEGVAKFLVLARRRHVRPSLFQRALLADRHMVVYVYEAWRDLAIAAKQQVFMDRDRRVVRDIVLRHQIERTLNRRTL